MSKLRKIKIGPAIREWRGIDRRANKAAETQYNYERCLNVLMSVVGSQLNTQELRAKHIDATIEALRHCDCGMVKHPAVCQVCKAGGASPIGRSEVSINNDRSILGMFVTWLQANAMLSPYQHPCGNLEFVKPVGKSRAESILQKEDLPVCFEVAGESHPSNRAMFALGVYACMRESEILALRWGNIDWEEGTITFWRQKPKDWHTVAMTPFLRQELKSWELWMGNRCGEIDEDWFVVPQLARSAGGVQVGISNNHNRPIYPDRKRAELARICHNIFQKAGRDRERWGVHTLRRTGACLWYLHTKDIRVVQGVLGHAGTKTTENYIKYVDGLDRLMAAAEGFDPLGLGALVTPMPEAPVVVVPAGEVSNVLAFRPRRAS